MKNWLINTVKDYGDHVALLSVDQSISYSELILRVNQAKASIVDSLKIKKDEKIAIFLENRIEYIIMIHAFSMIDAIPALINTRLTKREIRWQLDTLNISKIILSERTMLSLDNDFFDDFQCYTVDHETAKIKFLSLQSDSMEESVILDLDLNKIQSLIFTSGTTGNPKPAIIKYSNIWASSMGSADRLGIEKNDIWMLTLPIYHVGGLSIILRSCINGTTVFLDSKFSINNIIGKINQFKITIISLVPTMLHWLINNDIAKELTNLRLILLGGDRASTSLIENCRKLLLPIATTYGMTESVSQVATALPSTVYIKPLSVGKPLKGIEAYIVDEEGIQCETGQIGEIVLNGDPIIDGYFNISSDKFTKLGFYTGDMGYVDKDGDIFILQRRVDLIISGGENIYPSEVENYLRTIERVQDACVMGIDDVEWGQIPVALIQTDNDENLKDIIINNCRMQLAKYKIPKKIYFVDIFPRNSLGKINRSEIRKLIEEGNFN